MLAKGLYIKEITTVVATAVISFYSITFFQKTVIICPSSFSYQFQADSVAFAINFQDSYLDVLVEMDDLVGVFHVAVG